MSVLERDIAPDVPGVEVIHQPWQLAKCEVRRPTAGVEVLKPEIDRVRPVGDGCAHGFRVPRGGGATRAAKLAKRMTSLTTATRSTPDQRIGASRFRAIPARRDSRTRFRGSPLPALAGGWESRGIVSKQESRPRFIIPQRGRSESSRFDLRRMSEIMGLGVDVLGRHGMCRGDPRIDTSSDKGFSLVSFHVEYSPNRP